MSTKATLKAQPIEEKSDASEWLTTREAAVKLSCSLTQVQKMVEAGHLAAWKTPGGHRRVLVEEVNRHLAERGLGKRSTSRFGDKKAFRILIAEDDKLMHKVYAKKIEAWSLPIHLSFASNGYSALLHMAKNVPDLVIMDLKMPRIDGYDAIKAIREDRDFDRVEIIIVSGLRDLSSSKPLPENSIFYKKPVDFSKLNGFVEACIRRSNGN